jgi:transposase
MPRLSSWEISDEFWAKVEPLVPARAGRKAGGRFRRAAGAGRKALAPRRIFEAVVYVLRTGCQWKALSKARYGSASSVHKYFQQWHAAGFFEALWRAGLANYDELEGIAWRWQSLDGSMVKAPLAREAVGANPTDRGKKWEQAQRAGGRPWRPAVAHRRRGQ